MIEGFAAVARSLNEHAKVLAHTLLAAVVVEGFGPQCAVDVEVI